MGFLGDMYPDQGGGAGPSDLENKPVLSSVQVLDAVYLDSDGVYKRAQANDIDTSQVIGFVVSKLNSTTATIRKSGTLDGFSGLTTGNLYYLDAATAGNIDDTIVTTAGHVRIGVGVALSATELLIDINLSPSIVIRA